MKQRVDEKEMRIRGLLDDAGTPRLTPKGREWLRALEEAEARGMSEASESAADLVQSTNGLSR
jgi:hypothetical protein